MINVSISLVLSVLIFSLVGVRCRDSVKKYALPVRTSNKFAIEFHRHLALDDAYKDGNIVFSPVSLSMALGMVYLSARRNTSRQIDDVFHWNNTNGVNIHSGFRYLRKTLTSSKLKNKAYEMTIANRIWTADGFPILTQLKHNTRRYYGAGIATTDFSRDPNRAREKINSWVVDRTNGKIKELIPTGLLNTLTKMVVVNAMYFKGMWQRKFLPTTFEQFFDSSINGGQKKDRVKAQMMKLPRSELNYFEDTKENCQIIELPYAGNEASMVIVLPKKKAGSNVQQLEENLSYGTLRRWMKKLTKKNVTVYLPKFNMSLDLEVKSFLERMGIVDLFTPGVADLSGISGNNTGLFVKQVLHKAFVDVNERGTEAAAATGVIVLARSGQSSTDRIVFHADRPFLFYIHHKITNVILVMGRVKRPIAA